MWLMVSEFKDLTAEAIYDALAKMIDSKPINNPYVYNHADMHVAIAAGREHERERFARIVNTMLDKETAEDIIFLVNDVNVL